MRNGWTLVLIALTAAPAVGQVARPIVVGSVTGGTAVMATFPARRDASFQYANDRTAAAGNTQSLPGMQRWLRWRIAQGRLWVFTLHGEIDRLPGPTRIGGDYFFRLSLETFLVDGSL